MNIYKEMLDTFGEEIQYRFALEEMGELIQAICKYQRKKNSVNEEEKQKLINNIIEEIADVTINMEELAYIFGQEKINKVKREKLERALRRIKAKNIEAK